MNNHTCTEFSGEIHPSLRTLIGHACHFAKHALLNSTDIPVCLMTQSRKGISQCAYTGKHDCFLDRYGTVADFTEVAKDAGRAREVFAVAVIYRARVDVGPEWTGQSRHLTEKEIVVLNAESREWEYSLTFDILRDDSRAFIGLREVRKESRFGLLNKTGLPGADIWKTPKRKAHRVRKKSTRWLQNFDMRMFPFTPPSSENDSSTCVQ